METSGKNAMGRREFIGAAAAVFAGVVITVTGCSEDEPTGSGNGGKQALVESGGSPAHNHSGTVTKAELDAGVAMILTVSGNGHTHEVPLSAQDIANIKSGVGVHGRQSESTNEHTHIVHVM